MIATEPKPGPPLDAITDMAAVAAYPSPPSHSSPPGRKASTPSLYDKAAMATHPGQAYGGTGGADNSPLSTLNVNFLKSLTDKRTTRGTRCRRAWFRRGC